jgi:hypothetical protein
VVFSVFPTFRPGGGPGRSSPHRGRRHDPRAPAAPGAAALRSAPGRRRRPADPTKGAAGHGVDGGGCIGSNETREDLGDLDWVGGKWWKYWNNMIYINYIYIFSYITIDKLLEIIIYITIYI